MKRYINIYEVTLMCMYAYIYLHAVEAAAQKSAVANREAEV
jgi:hypothetical protein